MMEKTKSHLRKMPELALLLKSHHDEIIEEWAKQVHQIQDSRYLQFSIEEVRNWASAGLEGIIEAFTSGSSQVLDDYLTKIVFSRLDEGFHISEVTEALLLAKEASLTVIWNSTPSDGLESKKIIHQLDVCLRYMISYFGNLFSEAAHSRLLDETNRRLAESESIKRTLAALLQQLTLDEVFEIVCSEARKLTNATGSAVLLIEEDWLQVTFSTGNPLPALERLPLDDSLAGVVIQHGQPVLVNDPINHVHAYRRNPKLHSMLVIPLYIKTTQIGVIDVVNKPGGFTNDDIRIMSLFADQAAIAIENTRLHQHAEQLAVVRERQRLARDLHDSVTQTMYSISLYADAAQKALNGNKLDNAMSHLDELRKMVREAMLDMRLLIFELHPPILEKEGLVTVVKTRLDSVEARSGIDTDFKVFNERRLPLETETELYRIVQEGLTNIVKHAKADYVSLSMHYSREKFKLEIQDNGIGFISEEVARGGGLGLRNIQERVKRMKGSFSVDSVPKTGTTLTVTLDI